MDKHMQVEFLLSGFDIKDFKDDEMLEIIVVSTAYDAADRIEVYPN